MNHSRSRYSSSTPGFVYFNNSDDNLTYQYRRNSPNSSPQFGSPKYHSSPRQFVKRSRNSGGSRGNNSFKSVQLHESYTHHVPYKTFHNNTAMMSADGKRDLSMFYDQSCTLDPWKHLETEDEVIEKAEKIQSTVVSKQENKDEINGTSSETQSSSDDEQTSSDESTSSDEEST